MHAEDPRSHKGRDGHLVEYILEASPDLPAVDVAKYRFALVQKAIVPVDSRTFVVSTKEDNTFRIVHL